MKNYEMTIYSCDGSCDEKGDKNAVKSTFQHESSNILDLLDYIKFFLISSNINEHHLCLEIEEI